MQSVVGSRLTSLVVRPRTLRSRPKNFSQAKAKDSQAEAKAKDMQVEAKNINQGQRTFFQFQHEISKCGSFGHEILVRKQFTA